MIVQDDTADFVAHLRSLDISLRLESGRLQVCAPKNVLTPELRTQLANRKREISAFLDDSIKSLRPDFPAIDSVPRGGALPLSFAQSRLWFLDQLMPGSTAYTLPMCARLLGKLDFSALESSFTEIVRRHEILRTIFPVVDGSPNQVVLPPAPFAITVVDLCGVPLEAREAKAVHMGEVEARKPFDLAKGPLLRAELLRLGLEDHVLLITVHHIVFDGWSIEIFWQDLSALYSAFRAGMPSPLAELAVQYVDFASWQRRSLEGPVRESHLAYWKQQLGEQPPTLNLPTDRPREYTPYSQGAKRTLRISPALYGALKSLSKREGVSLSMMLLAAFNVLLHRLSGQDDILVGMPVACRNRAEFERMIGLFVNTMVVRTRFSETLLFRDLLLQIRDTMLDAHERQEMPFEELVGALNTQRDIHRTPLFQVFFNHLNMQLTPFRIAGLEVEPFGSFEVESKFDFTFYLHEQSDSIHLILVYNTHLFDDSRMAVLLDQYSRLLEQICNDPLRPVAHYSLLTRLDGGKVRLPDPTAPLDDRWLGSVHRQFVNRAREVPDSVAVVDPDTEWSYGQLERFSAGLAAWLSDRGIVPGDTVAVYGHRSAPLVLALLGILRAGAVFCILDPAYPASSLARRLRTIRPKAWLQMAAAIAPTDDLEAAIAATAGSCRLTLPRGPEVAILRELSGGRAWSDRDDLDCPAYVIFTSGTTGEPKCVLGTHKPLSHFIDWHVRQFELKKTDRFSMLSGLAHDPLLRDIFTPLWIGATLSIPAPDDILSPGRLPEWMEQQQITVAHLTPAIGALLAGSSGEGLEAGKPLSALRYAFFGGDVLTSNDVALLAGTAPQARCISFYGATETPQAMAWCRPDAVAAESVSSKAADFAKPIPIGTPIADVQVLILNSGGGLAGVGEMGEIYIRTPYLSQGYANDEILSRERFPTNPFTGRDRDRLYRTGDLGRYRPDGLVEFAGRSDQQIKIRGYRVEPGEIETALTSHPEIRECAVVAREIAVGEKRLVCYLVVRNGSRINLEDLREYLRKSVPDYLIPSEFVVLQALPLSPNGKVDHRALDSRKECLPSLKRYTPPRNHAEIVMTKIWSQVLGVEKLGVFDNFFELGGHSLAATRLIARLRSALEIDLPLQALFLEPTIAGLAKRLHYDPGTRSYRYMSTVPRWNCLVPAQPRGTRTPFFFVAGYQSADDTLLVLSRIIPHLDPDQPVFGFRPRWVEGAGEAYASVEEAAREFLAELISVQPNGPYLLGGYCVGGIIALEIARQLMLAGQKVALMVLLDTERPTKFRAYLADFRLMWRRAIHIADVIGGIVRSKGRVRRAAIRDLIHRKLGVEGSSDAVPAANNRFYELKVGFRRLGYTHHLRQYPGHITLIENELQYRLDKYMGWKGVALGGLEIHRVPGDHDTVLTQYGKEFAAVLLRCIDDALPGAARQADRSKDVQS
jgi:amino acid adenylation domain-containing protein